MKNNTIKCYGELISVYIAQSGQVLLNMKFKNNMLKTDRLTFTYYGDEPVDDLQIGNLYEVEGFIVSRNKFVGNEKIKHVQYFAATKNTESKNPLDAVRDGEGIKNGFNGYLGGIVIKKFEQNEYTSFVVKTNEKVSNYVTVAIKTDRLKTKIELLDNVSLVYNVAIKMTKDEAGKTTRRTSLYISDIQKR